jgi:hypothetical protein
MYDQYKKEYVDNHSVGMIYVKMKLAVDDKKHPEEFATWEKYYPQVVNQKEADRRGHMWIILEAKAVEGSAVPNGSNSLTPTMSVSSKESKKSKKELKKIAKKKELKSLIKAIKNY